MNRITSGFAAKFQAAQDADSWNLVLDKFSFHLGRDVPARSGGPDQRGARAKGGRGSRLRDICERYQAARSELEGALAARRAFLDRLEKQHGPLLRRVPLVNSGRLLLCAGRPGSSESAGLSCDRTTGLPVIPGSAVKELLRAWSRREAGEVAGARPAEENRRDGEGDAGDQEARTRPAPGDKRLIFLGGWPKRVPGLVLDSPDPPAGPAERGGKPAPRLSLAVEPGNEWEFGFLAEGGVPPDEARDLLDAAARRLVDALDQIGLGSRPGADYGRFLTSVRWAATNAGSVASAVVGARPGKKTEPKALPPRPSDYTNEVIFANRILKRLNPGAVSQIEPEIEKLRRLENASWRARLIEALRGKEMREVRRKLKEKDWFPQDWLPE